MAKTNADIILRVIDKASDKLKKIASGVDKVKTSTEKLTPKMAKINKTTAKVAKSVDTVDKRFSNFNRTLFATTAFVGMFTVGFGRAFDAMEKAATFDRMEQSFQRTFGDNTLLKDVENFSKTYVDNFTIMDSATKIKGLGMAKNQEQIAKMIAAGGRMGKAAGLSSAEGVKKYTQFLADGSISHLAFLKKLSSTNLGFKAYEAILSNAGGTLGGVLSTQARLAKGMELANAILADQSMEYQDLEDVVKKVSDKFKVFSKSIFTLIGKAFTPLISALSRTLETTSDLFNRFKEDSSLVQFTKNILVVGTAITTTFAALGTFKLLLTGLSALGIGGIPFIGVLLSSVAVSFMDVGTVVNKVTTFFKNMGAVLTGTVQLVSSFLDSSRKTKDGMNTFAAGVGIMDTKLHNFLQENGLLELTRNISKFAAVAIDFTRNVVTGFIDSLKFMGNTVSKVVQTLSTLFGFDLNKIKRDWLTTGNSMNTTLAKMAGNAIAVVAALKLLKLGKVFGKVPILGKLFGGTGAFKSKGTRSNPMFVKDVGVIKSSIFNKLTGESTKSAPMPNNLQHLKGLNSGIPDIPIFALSPTFSKILRLGGIIGMVILAFEGFKGIFAGIKDRFSDFSQAISLMVSKIKIVSPSIGSMLNSLGALITGKSGIAAWAEKATNSVADAFRGFSLTTFSEQGKTTAQNITGTVKSMQAREMKTAIKSDLENYSITDRLQALVNPNFKRPEMKAPEVTSADDILKSLPLRFMKAKGMVPEMDPQLKGDQIGIHEALNTAIQSSEGGVKDRMQEAFNAALSKDSAGKKDITAEEWENIFLYALLKSNSKMIELTKEQTEVIKENTITKKLTDSKRGGC